MGLTLHASDPAPRLEAVFTRIEAERMAGVPLLNPALRVQALPFGRWQGQWLGVLVTPWFLNLVLMPADAAGWRQTREGDRVFHHFAAGDFAFLGNDEPGLGEFQACSLISPMGQFNDQTAAIDTARAALAMLHLPPPDGASAASPCGAAASAARTPARRTFLFGRG